MYKVNEIFYSLQGEGRNTGRAAVFVRFSGCNLRCRFCDTDFADYQLMTAEEIVWQARSLLPDRMLVTDDAQAADAREPVAKKADGISDADRPIIVLTGGEPTLQVDEALIDAFHAAGFPFVAMESNGTRRPPRNLDWLTVSPKAPQWMATPANTMVVCRQCDELKVVFDGQTAVDDLGIQAHYYYLQPCDVGDARRNAEIMSDCIDYIKRHPRWRLSLQTHKLLGIR